MAEVVYGEVPVDTSRVAAEHQVSREALAKIATRIYTKIRHMDYDIRDVAAVRRVLKQIHDEHRDFARDYPVVVRYMVQLHKYREDAFLAYLRTINTTVWKDRKSFLDSQAEYLTILYKKQNPDCSARFLAEYQKQARRQLQKEDDEFKEAYAKAEEEQKQQEAEDLEARRRYLHQLLLARKAA